MGVIVGTDIPMFMGAMIAGPLGGLAIKRFDRAIDGKVKSGFEMLVNVITSYSIHYTKLYESTYFTVSTRKASTPTLSIQ